MLRLLTYISAIVILIIAASCTEINKQTNKKTNLGDDNVRRNEQILTIDNRTTSSLTGNNTVQDTSFIYSARVVTNIGDRVMYEISEIAMQTANVPLKNPAYHVNYLNTDYVIEDSPTILKLVFDNDIFNNTDYYYTNGVNIELVAPIAKSSPISNLLVGLPQSQINLYGFSLKQNIYTPTNPDIEEISTDDRPFSAFLTIGQFRESYNLQKNISVKSSINFGVLGPASMGGIVQSSIHNIEPVGWNNQINNSVVIDYSINFEKGIISSPNFELNLTAGGHLGTVFNNISSGFYFRTGSFIPVFRGLANSMNTNSTNSKERSPLQYWFFVSVEANIVLYDATLQGGLFSTKNPYTIKSEDINRFVAKLSVGFAMYYNRVGVEFQNFYLSPEFKNAYDFRWGRIKFIYQF